MGVGYRLIKVSLPLGAAIALLISWMVESGIVTIVAISKENAVYLGPLIAISIFLVLRRRGSVLKAGSWNGRERDYVESLTYRITDQRLLILRDGVIEEEFTVVEVNPKLMERRNAPGFGDIIWGGRV